MTDEIIALDLETTGLNPRTDSILGDWRGPDQKWPGGGHLCGFYQYRKKIPEFIVGLTGITDEMAAGGLFPSGGPGRLP